MKIYVKSVPRFINSLGCFIFIIIFLAIPQFANASFDNSVLVLYRRSLNEIRAGEYDKAAADLDKVIPVINGVILNNDDAKRARNNSDPEAIKPFIGEPYERSMAFFYRGFLYMHNGDLDNACACFKSGQVADTSSVSNKFNTDFYTFEFLIDLVKHVHESKGTNEKVKSFINRNMDYFLPANCNVVLFVEYGNAPVKYAQGNYNEILSYKEGKPGADRFTLRG